MTLEFLQALIPADFPDRDNVIKKIFAEKGKAVNAAIAKYADYDEITEKLKKAEEALAAANKTIQELTAKGVDVSKLQEQIAEYERKAKEAEAQAKAAEAAREIARRFGVVKGDAEFVDPVIEEMILAKFGEMVNDPANVGKGDAALYETLTKDKPFFKSQNPAPDDMGKPDANKGISTMTQEYFDTKATYTELTELRAKNPALYEVLKKNSKRK